MDEVKRLLSDEVFSEAKGVLEVVAKTQEQKRRSEAWLKFRRDEAARAPTSEQAREQGREEGRLEGIDEGIERGELFARIKTLQGLVGVAESTREELSDYSDEQLTTMLEQLRDQLRNRNV